MIVANDLEGLQQVTDEEQVLVDRITSLEAKRIEVIKNMATVLNKDWNDLNLDTIINILNNQPEEQRQLREIHDVLIKTVNQLKDINLQNKQLIEESLEMIEFNMNFIRSTRMSAGTGNYTKQASVHDASVSDSGMLDRKSVV